MTPVEGAKRDLRIDEIEALYYFAVASDPTLAGNFGATWVEFICRQRVRRQQPTYVIRGRKDLDPAADAIALSSAGARLPDDLI